MSLIKRLLLSASDEQLGDEVKHILRAWPRKEKAIDVLKLLDACVYCGGASGFVIGALELLLEHHLKAEGITYPDIVKQATWRNE